MADTPSSSTSDPAIDIDGTCSFRRGAVVTGSSQKVYEKDRVGVGGGKASHGPKETTKKPRGGATATARPQAQHPSVELGERSGRAAWSTTVRSGAGSNGWGWGQGERRGWPKVFVLLAHCTLGTTRARMMVEYGSWVILWVLKQGDGRQRHSMI